MKVFEKLILCCIWVCIAIVMVLIKDQVDLNQKINQEIEKEEITILDRKENQILFSEEDTADYLIQNIVFLHEADVEFTEDGLIELKVTVSDEMIEEIKNRIDHEVIELILPALKGLEVVCVAELSDSEIDIKTCQAGYFSVPQSVLEIANEKINEMWKDLIQRKGITDVMINEDGLTVMQQE